MTGDGDDIFGAEDISLFENFASDFGEGEAVGGGIEVADEFACVGIPLFVVRGNRREVNIPALSRGARQGWGTRDIYIRIRNPGLEAASVLDGLEGDATDAGLL